MPKNEAQILESNKSKALEAIKIKYNSARKASSLDFERFAKFYKLFRNRQTTKNYTGLASLFIPEPYRIIRKKTAKLANAIKRINVIPESENDIESSKIGTILLNFLRNKLNWFLTERTAIQESRIVGLSWLKILWNLDKEEKDKPYKGFDLTFYTADQILIDPDATILDIFNGDYKWAICEYETDLANLRKNPNYKNIDLDLLSLRGGSKVEKSSLSQARFSFINSSNKSDKNKKYKIIEFWGKLDLESSGEESNYLIVIADNTLVLRFEKNPYEDILLNPIPIVPFVANPIGQELYPVGDIEPAESLFNELNDTRNQRMDTVTLNIDPPKEVLKAANIDPKQLIARRGWIIESNIPGGVRFIPPDLQGVRAAIEEEKAIRGDIQQVTGVIDFAPGTNVQAGVEIDTARGAIIAKGEADVLIEDELNILKLSLKMLYRIVLAYAQNFLDRSFVVRIVDKGIEQFKNVSKDSIQGNLDLDIEMETLQDKTTTQQTNLLLFNQAKTVPGAKIGKFFIDVLETFRNQINLKEYYEEPQPQGPPPPNISVSLRGELNPLQTSDIAQIAGANPDSGDPLLDPNLRKLMGKLSKGEDILKEDNADIQEIEKASKVKELLTS